MIQSFKLAIILYYYASDIEFKVFLCGGLLYLLCLSILQNSFEPVAKFYIPLKINFSTMPAYIAEVSYSSHYDASSQHDFFLPSQDNPGPDEAALVVTFVPPNGAKVTPSLFLSPRIERYFV